MKLNRYLKLLWSIPLTWVLFIILVVIAPQSMPFPAFSILGNNDTVAIRLLNPKHLLYIGSYSPIEDEYSKLLSHLDFHVLDTHGNEVKVEYIDRFFYTGKAKYIGRDQERTVHGGSVFRLPQNASYPFEGILKSNIQNLEGIIWVQSSGSFAPIFLLILALFSISLIITYSLSLKKSK